VQHLLQKSKYLRLSLQLGAVFFAAPSNNEQHFLQKWKYLRLGLQPGATFFAEQRCDPEIVSKKVFQK
jgi:hypothetical protein